MPITTDDYTNISRTVHPGDVLIADHLSGLTSPEADRAIMQHLRTCRSCWEVLARCTTLNLPPVPIAEPGFPIGQAIGLGIAFALFLLAMKFLVQQFVQP